MKLLLYSFGQFLITVWIWAVTFARAHLLINMVVMLITLLFFKVRIITAACYALFSQFFTIIAFSFIVHVIIAGLCKVTFIEEEPVLLIHPLATSFLLAMIYTGLQILFFKLTRMQTLPAEKYSFAILISNIISMLIVYQCMSPIW